ncbi:MAG: response regulator [Deltaproteobacteria bacterium]|jgi:DNA-binding response OmpR family regulator|nr:response regulator [Deltaproteobacteria bacterium]MBW2536229.1 response regulator [Deltaproteobacteria bacterium]
MLPPRLLLVDDEADFVGLLAKRLRRRKLDVRVAGSAEAALAELDEHTFDVVVLDIRMPGMDGLQALTELRRRFPTTQVIMLTGFADTTMAAQALRCGAFAYLVKPVDVEELLDRIRAAASGQPPPAATAPSSL